MGETLSYELTCQVFESMMTGRVHHAEIGALFGHSGHGFPSGDEIAGAATIMRKHVRKVETSVDRTSLLDTAGTGGAPKTFNVSTAAAIVAAAGGANVAKHGNKSPDWSCSQRSFLKDWESTSRPRSKCKPDVSMSLVCVCFCPNHHPATKHVMPVRKALSDHFNLLGPLTNPVQAGRQHGGVWSSVSCPGR